MEPPSPWKRPNEVMQLHRLKRRKKALQERMRQPSSSCSSKSGDSSMTSEPAEIDFSRILDGEKRKNPFSKNKLDPNKKAKLESETLQLDESNDKTLFAILKQPSALIEKPVQKIENDKLSTFSNLLQKYTAEHSVEPVISEEKHKYLPIDWALKTKLRLMSPKPFAWSQKLKASEEASGITGFVRCIDTTSSPTLDTSPRARFHQACLYWQHPHLPWLNLYPRSSGRVAATSFLASNEEVKAALLRDWTESFRSLFQLLRARHCPYFYVCANTFTCLFRAGGLCGAAEPTALMAPTTRGLRRTLRQEDVEFTMPLRGDTKRKLDNSGSRDDGPRNASADSCYDTMDDDQSLDKRKEDERRREEEDKDLSGDEEDLDSDKFLSELGLETEVVKRINKTQARIQQCAESTVDLAAASLVVARGADAQALFNYLLNCRSLVGATGPCAGVPPTLLSPVAFHGGALQSLKVRESVVYAENNKYHSVELRGPLLPSAVHALFRLLRAPSAPSAPSATSAPASLSATFQHLQPTLAFALAAQSMAEEESQLDSEPAHFTKAFNQENLSDCGLADDMLRHFCAADPNLQRPLDSVKYDAEDDTYTW